MRNVREDELQNNDTTHGLQELHEPPELRKPMNDL